MWIGRGVCGVCLEAIDDEGERGRVRESLEKGGLEVLELTEEQIGRFAGNTIMLQGKERGLFVMSEKAFGAYT